MGEKEEIIKAIEQAAEEKGFSVLAGPLKKKSVPELREELERIKSMQPIQGAVVRGGRIELITEKQETPKTKKGEEVKVMRINPTNPFRIPTGDRKRVREWLENHLDLVASEEFKQWAYSQGGKKFLHKWATVSWELLEVIRETNKAREEMKSIEKEMESKAGEIGVHTRKKFKTIKELKETLERVKKRERELLEKEEQIPGYLELRRRALERMKKTREKLRKRRR